MKSQLLSSAALLASGVFGAREWLNEPDTGIELSLPDLKPGELASIDSVVGLPDFEYVARNYLPIKNYTYYRNGAGGEWAYRHNVEVFQQYAIRSRTMIDITNIEASLPTQILGHNFSVPFYITPFSRADMAHEGAETNLVKAAAAQNILYVPSHYAYQSIETIGAAKAEGQVLFQQLYLTANDTRTQIELDRAKAAGHKAIVFTIDCPAPANRHRAARFDVLSLNQAYVPLTWEFYKKLTTMTDLPIILKGIQTVEDAKLALENGVPGIILSNHGGRQLDTARGPLHIALEIHRKAPELFQKLEILADGGVRYGADALKLLALGVKAVGIGRPFAFANIYGQEGVERAIKILRREIAIDAANAGVADLKKITPDVIDWDTPYGYSG
ncbi:unnamed protein product [Clonostachys rhizophaga]|uniref:FMN hydroxy acid dehydrogenase domain-containing protein n=1 Tax=Clonostachys rhizophaga TaxID=160324 RepID=A0A9N9VWA1_9HYPO|nr:unnamed protein product [Clonostachys rhizophaga]